ncbi:hypothetical protein EDB81DRAFT_755356 [Dactylonectria macrodidyma]|uniref:Transmembrane protein n=1 Tax=Dactylonectria macrodidyma TaxID=307937 RepID=A0A9P9FFI5_9HYPO|nr:hypothetical protein EDB81DRAFT_755356 [Dactylonectria macrodidyma]
MASQGRYDPVLQPSQVTLVPAPKTQSDGQNLPRDTDYEQVPLDTFNTERGGDSQEKNNGTTTSTSEYNSSKFARKPTSPGALWELFFDLLLAVPAIFFLVFAALVSIHDGKPVDTQPVPKLRAMATYGPTIFPIAFAAVAANLLKAVAAWKLERGISVLSLQFLLRSRTVFSAFITPLALGAISSITPLILVLWALSPLGGQSALRVVGDAPSSDLLPWRYRYLDTHSRMLQTGPRTSAGAEILPAIVGAFTTALGTPADIKAASQDAFGNIKIPMVEAYLESNRTRVNGWYDLDGDTNITYSAISGLPIEVSDGLGLRGNHSFKMETSYMYTNCSVSHFTPKNSSFWSAYLTSHPMFNNGRTMVFQTTSPFHSTFNATPQELVFTSFSMPVVANATCSLKTSFVEVDVKCHLSDCSAKRIRPVARPDNVTALSVLDGVDPDGNLTFSNLQRDAFLETFVNATDTMWSADWSSHFYSTPIEYYITNPGSPYSDVKVASSGLAKIWTLVNTFWIANIAPFAATGTVQFRDADANVTDIMGEQNIWPYAQDGVGIFTPDILVLRAERAWLGVLVLSSAAMLIGAVVAACLGALRRGPDILDYTTSLMRDNPYVNDVDVKQNSMEDGTNQMRRLKN